MLKHSHSVANTDSQSTTGTPFTDNHADDRSWKTRHIQDTGGDELGLTSFLGTDTRKSSWGIDQTNNGKPILGGQFHFQKSFSIAFRMSAAVIALRSFGESLSFLMTDEHHFLPIQPGEAGSNCSGIAKCPVSMQFEKLIEHRFHVIHR